MEVDAAADGRAQLPLRLAVGLYYDEQRGSTSGLTGFPSQGGARAEFVQVETDTPYLAAPLMTQRRSARSLPVCCGCRRGGWTTAADARRFRD